MMLSYTRFVKKIADHRQSTSLAAKYRKQRFALFLNLIEQLDGPITILDVGGTERFWNRMLGSTNYPCKVILLNKFSQPITRPNFSSQIGDARAMRQFTDKEFDIVFSNSVIEHVGSFEDQRRMANEVRRVGNRYFIQTPNRYFPLEPHFLFPLFQFFPIRLKCWFIQHFDMGWRKKTPDYQSAMEIAKEIRLLSKKEFTDLFPEGQLVEERFLGLVKSFTVYYGW